VLGKNYSHMSCEKRTMIQLSLERFRTLREIARSVRRAPSS
jgi:IS30 family transposase